MLEEYYTVCLECGDVQGSWNHDACPLEPVAGPALRCSCAECGGTAVVEFLVDALGCVVVLEERE